MKWLEKLPEDAQVKVKAFMEEREKAVFLYVVGFLTKEDASKVLAKSDIEIERIWREHGGAA